MRFIRSTSILCIAAMLASCGGSSGTTTPPPIGGGGGGGGGGGDTCALSARQAWVLGELEEWYLFPDLLDTSVNPANHDTVQSYIDALVKPARDQGIDRGFTYITSIQEENDFIQNATTQDFGWSPVLTSGDRLYLREVYERGPAFALGIDRGTEIVRIGTSQSNLRTPAQIIAQDGIGFLSDLVFPTVDGTTVYLEFRTVSSSSTVSASLTSAEYELQPISPRYGVELFPNGSEPPIGYINLRTFFSSTAEADLAAAFKQFNDAGVNKLVIDLRYNGGGLVSVAEYFGDLLGKGRVGQVFSRTTFRSSKSANNSTELFQTVPNAVNPMRIAFVTTGSSASASELLANSMRSYLKTNSALVGRDTFGKPVGQIARDRSECDDRLRVLAFKTESADGVADYYDGLASVFTNNCAASDDIFTPLGTVAEDSIGKADEFARTGTIAACTPMSQAKGTLSTRQLSPTNPNFGQRVILGML
ncbi:S41 family peptidase [Sphingomicrobium lutaoense]|uniref:C-terminal processing protease CtpA/Prc n=1 Tax=Sphingomicrobium lutaoense TaxID=515949 RepID=A0A839Z3R4_9SPHN|nr:S41 family peptidase [Sphingomicrobium lutaoense]MBB3764727.1 C-terminal processing protease CtpA/Prc [Sphingomicrobium lutaoense]